MRVRTTHAGYQYESKDSSIILDLVTLLIGRRISFRHTMNSCGDSLIITHAGPHDLPGCFGGDES